MEDQESQVIHSFARNQDERVLMSIRRYKGKYYVDLRIWFQTEKDPNFRPTKKGLSFLMEHLPELDRGVDQLLKARERVYEKPENRGQ